MPEVWYVAVENDDIELPRCVANTAAKLAIFLGVRATSVLSVLYRSPDGYGTSRDKRFRYYRMNADTGEIIVGKLPDDVVFKQYRKEKTHGKNNPQ